MSPKNYQSVIFVTFRNKGQNYEYMMSKKNREEKMTNNLIMTDQFLKNNAKNNRPFS